jgi:hypothetical protein
MTGVPQRAPQQIGYVMPEYQPVSSVHTAAIQRPCCPDCRQNRMLLSKLEAGPDGYEYRTFECQKCGRVETTIASRKPLILDRLAWLIG